MTDHFSLSGLAETGWLSTSGKKLKSREKPSSYDNSFIHLALLFTMLIIKQELKVWQYLPV
jgi:hypothetical protein